MERVGSSLLENIFVGNAQSKYPLYVTLFLMDL